MRLRPKTLATVLRDRGVTELYHANTVATACTFLREEALLSRGTVERAGLRQTAQYSDSTDKELALWFDVFLDSIDIHDRASGRNNYGPVCFVFSADLVEREPGGAWVTKLNPTKWAGLDDQKRWFTSPKEFKDGFTEGEFDQMFVFRHSGGEIAFGDALQRIVLDDPGMMTGGVNYYSQAYGALLSAVADAGLKIPIEKRNCTAHCRCVSAYKAMTKACRWQMFSPDPGGL